MQDSTIVVPRKQNAEARVGSFRPARPGINGGFTSYDDRFHDIIGRKPVIELILENATYPFAHEACVYLPETGDIWITSNQFVRDQEKHIQISRVRQENGEYRCYEEDPGVHMGNGAVNYKDGVLFCEQGTLTEPGGLKYMEPRPPYKTEMVCSNFMGKWFNSVNDAVVAKDGAIWFTDPNYGFGQGIRPLPRLPNQVYRYDPANGSIRAVADGLGMPNGLCFSPGEDTLYITDTAAVSNAAQYIPHNAASIYAYDVIYRHGAPFLANKRLFAFTDDLIPDGIKCDTRGNVYSGCGGGVHVWAPGGDLLGKITVPGVCANFCFGRDGELFILNEHRMWRAQLGPETRGALLGI